MKNSLANSGRHQLDPWPSKIPHAAGLLSPHATATEPVLQSLCSAARQAHTPQLERTPHSSEDPAQPKTNGLKRRAETKIC